MLSDHSWNFSEKRHDAFFFESLNGVDLSLNLEINWYLLVESILSDCNVA
jgi:hypothetical protein